MNKTACTLALGRFDGVHTGHGKIIEETVFAARRLGVRAAVCTFDGDVAAALKGEPERGVFVLIPEERDYVLRSLGIDDVYSLPTGGGFLDMEARGFLEYIDGTCDPRGYFCGFDYTFGKGARGDVGLLREYAREKGRFVRVVNEVKDEYGKISATRVKKLLSEGNVAAANALLVGGYFIGGTIVKDRGVGAKLGFPTINIYPDERKFPLKNAVYKGHAELDGKVYAAVINYGARPTYGLSSPLLEAHLVGYGGDAYGKYARVYFDGFLREITAFDSEEELKNQLRRDAEAVK